MPPTHVLVHVAEPLRDGLAAGVEGFEEHARAAAAAVDVAGHHRTALLVRARGGLDEVAAGPVAGRGPGGGEAAAGGAAREEERGQAGAAAAPDPPAACRG